MNKTKISMREMKTLPYSTLVPYYRRLFILKEQTFGKIFSQFYQIQSMILKKKVIFMI